MNPPPWHVIRGEEPVVATAIHDGHELRDEIAELLVLPEADRFREEDPFTGRWTEVAGTRIVPRRSRFEVDLNRPREKAVYVRPEDAWGLELWREPPSDALVARSLEVYDAFYREAHAVLSDLVARFGCVVLLDLHSYNHRRDGPDAPSADPAANPEVNVGTGTLDRERFGPVVDRFIADLSGFDFGGRRLDVRENVRFRGGHFSRWIHETFPGTVCTLAIEFKKFFMDEWSGKIHEDVYGRVPAALESTLAGLRETLAELPRR